MRAGAVVPPARALRIGVLSALVVLCLVSLLAPLSAYVRQQSDLAALDSEVERSRARVVELTAATERWEDPAYVSAQARARLQYALPGETSYRVLDAGPGAGGSGAGGSGAGGAGAASTATGPTGADGVAGAGGADGVVGPGGPGALWYEALSDSLTTAGAP